ncbi:MAG: thioesterase family protein [Alphaproteobacteria bacterium]|nr:thioesterase family protein [Alphaproteobacteria bacterium SS10]
MSTLPDHRGLILDEWLDYNGHLNVAYYLMAFDQATDQVFDHLGVGERYVKEDQHSLFAVEQHLIYDREMRGGAPFKIGTSLVDYDGKRLHLLMVMTNDAEGYQAASAEMLFVHVNMQTRRSAPMPEALLSYLAAEPMLAADDPLAKRVGRSMAMVKSS